MKPTATETYKLVSAKSKESIKLLYERYGTRLFNYALHSWKTTEDEAWDLVYKTLYRVIETTASYTFQSEEKYRGFIFKIFVNYLRNHYRDKKKAREQVEVVNYDDAITGKPDEEVVEEDVDHLEGNSMSLLREELEKLEDWERVLLLLRSQDMAYADIAKYVNRPADQLKVYYHRLKAMLVKRMNEKLSSSKDVPDGKL